MFIFIILVLIILLSSHYLVFISLVKIFTVNSHSGRTALFSTLFFLSISFILASFLAHWVDNFFTRGFYYLSGLWLGILTNLIVALAFTGIVYSVSRWLGWQWPIGLLGIVFLSAALVFSAYGVRNAAELKVKSVSVTIQNLPPGWQDKKIVQISDVHLGHIYRRAYMEEIVSLANAQKPEIVVITGDIFDGMDGDLASLVSPLNDLEAPQGVFFVTGNHETYLGLDNVRRSLEKTKVRILDGQKADLGGLQLIGVGYPGMGEDFDLGAAIQKIAGWQKGLPTVLLFHAPTNIEQAIASDVNLQLSGHTHKGQLFPFNYITKLVYKNYDYGLYNLGMYSLYVSSGAGTWGPAMRTSNGTEIVAISLK